MELVFHVTLAFFIASAAIVRSEPGVERGDLNSESSRQKIYEIISSHEDRKYGDHGGHEYEEGEVPRKSRSRKYKRYNYQPDESNYYFLDQPKHSSDGYPQKPQAVYLEQPKHSSDVYAQKPQAVYLQQPKHSSDGYVQKPQAIDAVYVLPNAEGAYPVPKGRYPTAETAYVDPKKEYAPYDNAYVAHKRPETVYVVPKRPKDHLYGDHAVGYAEDKTAPITIGKTARTVYPKPRRNTHYPVTEAKHPSEYVVLEGQKPPRPLILDPKLKATYQHSQPEAHYSSPQHHVVLKPEVSVPVHYPAPVKDYGHYADHHNTEEKGHQASGHGYYGDNAVKKESGHKAHGHHDVSGHKAHSAVAAHHDEHGHHHNRGLYERDRGYHYEKAYAYDRIRAHHDVGSTRGAHASYGAHQGQEAHKDAGHHGAEHYSYFKKDDHGAGYGYHDGNSLYKKGDRHYGHKYIPTYYHG